MQRHPGASTTSNRERDKIILANKSKFDDVGHHRYSKRKVYLMPDGSYASRTDTYMKAWGYDGVKPEHVIDASTVDYTPSYAKLETFGVEGEDYVTCAECGFKSGNIARHLREKHNIMVEEYQSKYNGAPTKSRKVAEALHNGSLKKWRTQFANGTSTPAVKTERAVDPKNRKLYIYEREYEGTKLLVICSFTADQVRFDAPEGIELDKALQVLGNYEVNFVIANGFTTRPYELRVYLIENGVRNEQA